MNKAYIGLAIIILVGAGGYFLLQPKGGQAPDTTVGTSEQTNTQQSLSSLVAAGQPVTCLFSTTTPAGSTSGTVYVANGMVAGDFTTHATQGVSIDSHMMVRDNTNYVWSSLSTTGYKSTVSANAASNTTNSTDNNGVDYNAQMPYNCSAWTADSSKFTLPSTISFMTTSSYTAPSQGAGATGAAPSGAPKGTAAQCSQCNALPGAQKAQCIAALQC